MPSSASQRLRVELQAIGENLNSWGDTRLNEALKRLEEGIAKVLSVTVAGSNVTLTSSNYVEDEARSAVLVLGGTPGATRQVIIPLVQKHYFVVNNTDADQRVGGSTGNYATIRQGKWGWIYCDATNTQTYDPEFNDLKAPTASLDVNGQKIVDAAAGTASTDVATLSNKVHQFAAPTAALAMNSQKITGLADGTNPADAVNKAQVEAITAANAAAAAASAAAALVSENNASDSEDAAAASAAAALVSENAAAGYAASINPSSLVPNTRTVSAGTGLTGGGDLSANRTLTVDLASASNFRAGTANKVLEADAVWDAAAYVTVTDGASQTFDLSAGINFSWTLGASRTMSAMTNLKDGQSGMVKVIQDGTGGWTLAFNSQYKFAGGTAFSIDTTAGRISYLPYHVDGSTVVLGGLAGVR